LLRSAAPTAPGNAALQRDRALDCIGRARELDQDTIAREPDHAAAVLGDERLDEVLAMGPEPRVRGGFVLTH
jgi:hypothetical protein